MTNLFEPPPVFALPVSKGGDLHVTFVYKPLLVNENGDPVLSGGQKQYIETDYPDGSSVQLVIETDGEPITADATITGSKATVHEDKAVADEVKNAKLWRVVITFADGFDQVMANGTTVRYDGKKKA